MIHQWSDALSKANLPCPVSWNVTLHCSYKAALELKHSSAVQTTWTHTERTTAPSPLWAQQAEANVRPAENHTRSKRSINPNWSPSEGDDLKTLVQLLHFAPLPLPVVCQHSTVLLLNLNLINSLNKFWNKANSKLIEWIPAGLSGGPRCEDKRS